MGLMLGSMLASEVLRAVGYDEAVSLAGGDYSASEYKAIISRCDLVVAERMHAAIAGLSTGVPTMVVGYSIKAGGILTDMLGEELTQSCALVPLNDFLEAGAGLERTRRAWENREALGERLAAQLPLMKQRASAAFDILTKPFS